jgi:hypothetical protein
MLDTCGSNEYKYLTLAGLDLRFFIYIPPHLTIFDAPARISSMHSNGAGDYLKPRVVIQDSALLYSVFVLSN